MSKRPDWNEARRKAQQAPAEMSDEEDAAITADANADPDNPPADDLIVRRGRGRPRLDHPKQRIQLRVDEDVLQRFKAGGTGWQTRMNSALRKAAGLK
jgi:uncharacterized protein (DUF4415 family)